MIHTICFIVGIGFSFLLLGLGFSAIGQFFKGNRIWFARVSGIIMIWFGIYQLRILGKSRFLEKEHRISPVLLMVGSAKTATVGADDRCVHFRIYASVSGSRHLYRQR